MKSLENLGQFFLKVLVVEGGRSLSNLFPSNASVFLLSIIILLL